MGLNIGNAMSNLGAGLIQTGQRAVDQENKLALNEQQSELALDRYGKMKDIDAQIENDKRERIAEVVRNVQRDPKATEGQHLRNVGDALNKAGYIEQGDKQYDNARQADTTSAQIDNYRSQIADRVAKLKLTEDDRKNLEKLSDEYANAAGMYASLPDNTPPDMKLVAKNRVAKAGAKLAKYGIKVSDLDAGHASQIKVVKGQAGEGDKIVRDDGRGGLRRVDPDLLPVEGSGATGDEIRYDDAGNGYRRGADGKPVLVIKGK